MPAFQLRSPFVFLSLFVFCTETFSGCALEPLEKNGGTDAEMQSPLNLPITLFNYARPPLPEHFRRTGLSLEGNHTWSLIRDRTPVENPVTDAGATLGRVLFYDVLLSQNKTISCSSCHQAQFGFSDNKVKSDGFAGKKTNRHSMGLTNARYTANGRYFWDERAESLEAQMLMPLQDEVEMGMTLDELINRVGDASYYPPLFVAAFGDAEISSERIAFALAQFVRSLLSFNTSYDVGRAEVQNADENFAHFTDEENRGKALFMNSFAKGGFNCIACHLGESFASPVATSNGLDLETTDRGLGGTTQWAQDDGRFRVPSLRNIAVGAPYMHDGRFADLDAVLEHYSHGIQAHPALTVYLTPQGEARRLDFSDEEKAALKAFLLTLTDEQMLQDEKFQDPFLHE